MIKILIVAVQVSVETLVSFASLVFGDFVDVPLHSGPNPANSTPFH